MHPLAPLLILFTILGILGFIGYVVYSVSNDIADKTSQKMQKKNIMVTKDGMKVGVREVREESYVDVTQRYEPSSESFIPHKSLIFLSLYTHELCNYCLAVPSLEGRCGWRSRR